MNPGLFAGLGAFLFFSGLPLFLLVALLGLVLLLQHGMMPQALALKFLHTFDNPTLLCIPCFIFQGVLITESVSGQTVTALVVRLLGRVRGGVGAASVLTCGFFSALSGSSPSALVAAGGMLRPALLKGGMDDRRAVGLLTVAGSLGVLLPPSVPVIIYGVVARQDPVDMFQGCAVAAVGLLVLFSVMGMIYGRGKPAPGALQETQPAPLPWLLLKTIPVLLLPVGTLGLVAMGWATVQAASALGVFYVLLVETLLFRTLLAKGGLSLLGRSLQRAASMTAAILFIVAMGGALNLLTTELQIAEQVTQFLTRHFKNPWSFLIAVNVLFLVAGGLMDIYASLLLFVPLLLPTAESLGLNMVHLGVVILLNLEAGFVTPPFALNLFAASTFFDLPLMEVARRCGPFLLAMLVWLLVLTFVPGLVTWVM